MGNALASALIPLLVCGPGAVICVPGFRNLIFQYLKGKLPCLESREHVSRRTRLRILHDTCPSRQREPLHATCPPGAVTAETGTQFEGLATSVTMGNIRLSCRAYDRWRRDGPPCH